MKQTSAANVALFLVFAGWLLAYYGVMSQLGDPSPSVPRTQIEAERHFSLVVLCIGVVCVLAALWLSGYSFSAAKVRASACAALVSLPSVTVIASLL
jgi:divalent metal cation (Fe/Co/Zn/Cd) transporter